MTAPTEADPLALVALSTKERVAVGFAVTVLETLGGDPTFAGAARAAYLGQAKILSGVRDKAREAMTKHHP